MSKWKHQYFKVWPENHLHANYITRRGPCWKRNFGVNPRPTGSQSVGVCSGTFIFDTSSSPLPTATYLGSFRSLTRVFWSFYTCYHVMMSKAWPERTAASQEPEAGWDFIFLSSFLAKRFCGNGEEAFRMLTQFPHHYPLPPKFDSSEHRAAASRSDHQEPLVFSLVAAFCPYCFLCWQLISSVTGRWQESHCSIKAYMSPEHVEDEKEETWMGTAERKELSQADLPSFRRQGPPRVPSMAPHTVEHTVGSQGPCFPDLHVLPFMNNHALESKQLSI